MKRPLTLICICATISMALHLYLSNRAESLAAGAVNEPSSICHINEHFNCDSTLISNYSHFAGTHLSNWGFATHLIIAFLSLILIAGWTENRQSLSVALWAFSLLSFVASLIMLSISYFILHAFCMLCCILYVLSFIILLILLLTMRQPLFLPALKHTQPLTLVIIVCFWAGSSILSHLVFIKINDTKSSTEIVKAHFQDWLDSPVKNTEEKALLLSGSDHSPITITEFADFLCHHCRNIHYMLKVFKASHPSIKMRYFSFPLDQCQGKTASCFLTRAVYCAEKQNQGWALQDTIYQHQKNFLSLRKDEEIFAELKRISQTLELNWNNLSDCLNSPPALNIPQQQLTAGEQLNITSTPTLFVNGRKMNHQYVLKTLKAISDYLSNNKL